VAEYADSTACSNRRVSNNTSNGFNAEAFKKVFSAAFGADGPLTGGAVNEYDDDPYADHSGYQGRGSDALSLPGLRQPMEAKENSGMLTGRSCESLFNKITVTDNMSCEERSIHQFLDMQAINQLNVRQYLDSLRQIESPDVKKQLSQQPVRLNLQQRRELMFGQAQ
jgi:hypothetical protein